uniref:Amine oxidase domain-containing protein n=1 Tax=Salix viminalis TaxID=40686 RepID=A0A6N2KLI4_SALVM
MTITTISYKLRPFCLCKSDPSIDSATMSNVATKVVVVGSGISGAVCASALAKNGISVTLFESARGPGGRMSQRREISEDGKELLFDHGAPFFSVSNCDVLKLVHEWESKGLVAEWKENFGSFDCISKKFLDNDQILGLGIGHP